MPNNLNDWQKLFLESFRLIAKQPILAFLITFLVILFGFTLIGESYRFWRHVMLGLMVLSVVVGIIMQTLTAVRTAAAPKEPKEPKSLGRPPRSSKIAVAPPSSTSGGPVDTSPAPAQKPGD